MSVATWLILKNIFIGSLTMSLAVIFFVWRKQLSLAKSRCEEAFNSPEKVPKNFGPGMFVISGTIIFLTGLTVLWQNVQQLIH